MLYCRHCGGEVKVKRAWVPIDIKSDFHLGEEYQIITCQCEKCYKQDLDPEKIGVWFDEKVDDYCWDLKEAMKNESG